MIHAGVGDVAVFPSTLHNELCVRCYRTDITMITLFFNRIPVMLVVGVFSSSSTCNIADSSRRFVSLIVGHFIRMMREQTSDDRSFSSIS